MARIIVANGLADKDFIEKRANISFPSLKEHLSPYTLEFAEKESGVRAEDIEMLAFYFAKNKPSLAMAGSGAFEHENGCQNVRCVALLNWLVGNLEIEGGIFLPRYFRKQQGQQGSSSDSKSTIRKLRGIVELSKEKIPVDTYLACFSNPAYDEPDCQSTIRLLEDEKTVPFLVVIDTHLTETASLADLVLPAATYLEGWGLKVVPGMDMAPVLNLRQPVVSLLSEAEVLRSPSFEQGKLLEPVFRPRGESKELGNFCLELASRLGGDVRKSFPYDNTLDYIKHSISLFPELQHQSGLSILKAKGFWADKSRAGWVGIPEADQGVVVYSEKQTGQPPLPEYQPIASHKNKKEGEFVLTTFKTALTSRGTTNSKWIQEIFHENRLWMNKQAASKLNIKNGDRVRVISPAGAIITSVLVTERIHPDSVAIAEGFGHKAGGHFAQASPFSSPDQDSALIWWKKSGNGENPNEVIERRQDRSAGGFALKDTVVRIEKI
jgi:anaerobic selenocysteine-containing dehydrogenase